MKGYEPLIWVLNLAAVRAFEGKGKERHSDGKAFIDQPIIQIQELLGSIGFGFPAGQIIKKITEFTRMDWEKGKLEILDIIVYAASIYIQGELNAKRDVSENKNLEKTTIRD